MMRKLLFCLLWSALDSAPLWFENPSLDSKKLYGFGVGQTPSQAKQEAIIDLSRSLKISVESLTTHQTQRHNARVTSETSYNTQIDSRLCRVQNLHFSHLSCMDELCYARVEITKQHLSKQIKIRLDEEVEVLNQMQNPFLYLYKKEILYPQILEDKNLYEILSGDSYSKIIDLGQEPQFELIFDYRDTMPQNLKDTLESTLREKVIRFGRIVPSAEFLMKFHIYLEEELIGIDLLVMHQDEVLESANVYEIQKPQMNSSFFLKRLGVQVYKKIQSFGEKRMSKLNCFNQ